MKLALIALATLMPLVPLPTSAATAHGACDSGGNLALGIVSLAGLAYVDDRNYVQGNSVWVYAESNGLAGLQRGGTSRVIPNDTDTCYDDSTRGPDMLMF